MLHDYMNRLNKTESACSVSLMFPLLLKDLHSELILLCSFSVYDSDIFS